MTTRLEFGCYVDTTHGVYAGQRLCEIAIRSGWVPDQPIDLENLDPDDYCITQAMDWMNLNIAEKDCSFCWYEGAVMYWPDSEWENVFG